MYQALRDEYRPDGTSEEAAVFNLASLHWKRRRLERMSKLASVKREADALADASSDGWKGFADDIRAMAKSQSKAVQIACDELFKRMEDVYKSDQARAGSGELAQIDKLSACIKELNVINKELIVPTLQIIEKHNLDQTGPEREYRPDIMDKELKIHAEIDRRIEKSMQQLVRAKEYKNFYPPKSIEVKKIELTSLPTKLPSPSDGS
jgi:hypothetical protein